MQQQSNLPWTGERFIPSVVGELALEHLHRYALAQALATGKRVLDIACGEGYGAHLLSKKATSVIGVDLDENTVEHASKKYHYPNLKFLQGDCTSLPLPNSCIDLAVSFETLEHHAEHDAMLAELRRVLTPNGVLLISTPDRYFYSDTRNYTNEFHVKELYSDEFRQLILRYFPAMNLYGQRISYSSLAIPMESGDKFITYSGTTEKLDEHEGIIDPLYLFAVASAGNLPQLPPSQFDGTAEQKNLTQQLLNDLAVARDQLARTHLQLEAVYASIYWRITYPLRQLRAFFRKFFYI